jgi:monoterpene epsilon-lactone hydrolase
MNAAIDDANQLESLIADLRKWGSEKASIAQRRATMDRAEQAFRLPDGVTASPWQRNELRGQWLSNAAATDKRTVLYLHGGGYCLGSSRSHRHLAGAVARAAGANALALDYRLAPEHPFPAGLDDAVDAYAALLEATPAKQVVIAGDSAGGGLTLATFLAARGRGLPAPGALVCMSPWLDLTGRPLSQRELARLDDPVVSFDDLGELAAPYLNGTPADAPLASPLFADLNGLPPTLVQVSSDELLFRDSLELASRVAGSALTLEIESSLPHVWQWFWPRLNLGRAAIDRIGAFVDRRLGA